MNRAIKSALALVLLLTSYTALWADAQLPPVPPASSSIAGKAKCDGTTTLCDTDGTMHATNGGSVGITQATGDVTTPPSSTGLTVFTIPTNNIVTAMINALAVTTAKINDLAVTTAKIADGAITTAKHATNSATNAVLAQMAAHTFKGNNTGSTANALDLTAAQLTAELSVYTTLLQGEVPASVTNNHSKVLWDDGWGTAPAGGGGGGSGTVTNPANLTTHAPLIGGANGTTDAKATAAMSNGQLLVGGTGVDPAPQTVSGDCTMAASGAITCTKINGDASPALLDVNQAWTKGQAVTPTTGGTQSAGGTLTPDFSLSNSVTATFGAGNLTITNPTNVKAGQSYVIALTQDGTGSRTVTWGTNYKWAGATAPTLSTAAGSKDIISCFTDTTTTINCTLAVKAAS